MLTLARNHFAFKCIRTGSVSPTLFLASRRLSPPGTCRYATSSQDSAQEEEEFEYPSDKAGAWDAIKTTTATLMCLGIAGYGYHKYYKGLVLRKIENAFKPGDPALDLTPSVIRKGHTQSGSDQSHWVTRHFLYAEKSNR